MLLFTGGCANLPPGQCMLEPFAAADVANQNAVDCGASLNAGDGGVATASAWAAAQKCVLDALCASGAVGCTRRAFTLIYDTPPAPAQPPQHLRGAFTGVPNGDGSRIAVKHYVYSGDQHGSGDLNPSISAFGCQGNPPVFATRSCTPDVGRPCLDCAQPTLGTLLCGSQP